MPEKSVHESLLPEEAWQLILQTQQSLNESPFLNKQKETAIAEAIEVLKSGPKTGRKLHYAEFVHCVLRDAGGEGVLVCVVALGQTRVVRMKNKDRTALLDKIKENSGIFVGSNTTLLLVRHSVPRSMNGTKTDLQLLQQLTIR